MFPVQISRFGLVAFDDGTFDDGFPDQRLGLKIIFNRLGGEETSMQYVYEKRKRRKRGLSNVRGNNASGVWWTKLIVMPENRTSRPFQNLIISEQTDNPRVECCAYHFVCPCLRSFRAHRGESVVTIEITTGKPSPRTVQDDRGSSESFPRPWAKFGAMHIRLHMDALETLRDPRQPRTAVPTETSGRFFVKPSKSLSKFRSPMFDRNRPEAFGAKWMPTSFESFFRKPVV